MKNLFNQKRKQKGSLVAFLLIFALFGLIIVVGVIAVELLVKWVTMARMQTAAQAGAMAYARELIKLRDNEMGELAQRQCSNSNQRCAAYNLTFAQTQRTRSCDARSNYSGCSPVNQTATGVTGSDACANFIECITASQLMLFEIRNLAQNSIQDASQITNLTKNQCYKPANETRFAKFNNQPECAGPVGMVISPITQLDWRFEAGQYGAQEPCTRVVRDNRGLNAQKDFCAEAEISARLDPILAGGLPFLTGSGIFERNRMVANNRRPIEPVDFIANGWARIRARAIVMRPDFGVDETGAGGAGGAAAGAGGNQQNVDFSRSQVDEYYRKGEVLNLSTETVSLENCTSFGGQCAN
ncbi:MAG: hypothetical protein SFU25_02435 [Candidatus Caenarcaniphilales bacterium]|nr:hypothetical protein [Candidatus Caenarcaniphilales bacterium]